MSAEMLNHSTGLATMLLVVTSVFLPAGVHAMELRIVGNQMILSGPVIGDEPSKVRDALSTSPGIDTVILRNSEGGNAPSGYHVGQLIREHHLHTAVSGYCYSSCSRMFLGGSTRYFTDDYLPESNDVGFHGHYISTPIWYANTVCAIGSSNIVTARPTRCSWSDGSIFLTVVV
jgi:hypothetical protein